MIYSSFSNIRTKRLDQSSPVHPVSVSREGGYPEHYGGWRRRTNVRGGQTEILVSNIGLISHGLLNPLHTALLHAASLSDQ